MKAFEEKEFLKEQTFALWSESHSEQEKQQ